nr:MAG TPA: hypothetical protein [Caudoviricetes sp.]
MIIYGYIKAYSLYTSICLIYLINLWCELMPLYNNAHHRKIVDNLYHILYNNYIFHGAYIISYKYDNTLISSLFYDIYYQQ